jgi:hypothetical protein
MINSIGISIGTINVPFSQSPVATAATGIGMTSFTANWNAYSGASYYLLDVSISSSFSTFILQETYTTSTSYAVTGLISNTTYYYRVRAATGIDSNASSYISRVYAAGGSLSTNEQIAVNQFLLDMKAANVFTPMKAMYPMLGASKNLLSYTENLTNAVYQKGGGAGYSITTTANYDSAPNGTITASRVQITRGTTYAEIFQRIGTSSTSYSAGTYTVSFYGKSLSGTPTLYAGYSTNGGYVLPCTFTSSWQRFSVAITVALAEEIGFNLISYNGLPTTSTSADVLIWGVQVEQTSSATSYLPVYGSRAIPAAAAFAQNLVSSSFTGTFSSGWTFASTGVTGNATSTFMNTGFIPSANLTNASGHYSIYSRTDINESSIDLGVLSATGSVHQIIIRLSGDQYYSYVSSNTGTSTSNANSLGLYILNRNSSSNTQGFKNGSEVVNGAQSAGLPTEAVYIGGRNQSGASIIPSSRQYAFASMGDGLTNTQASNFYTAVQAFQTTLSRQV